MTAESHRIAEPVEVTDPAAAACRVFGIVPSDVALPGWDEADVATRDIRLATYDGVAAVVEEVEPSPQAATRGDLVAHSLVLNTLAAGGTPVIPVRFGSVMESRNAVVDELLAPRYEHWTNLLQQGRGRCQFTLGARYVQDVVLREIVEENPEVAELRKQTLGEPEDVTYGGRVRLGELVAAAMTDKRAADVETLETSLLPLCEMHRTSPGSGLDNVADIAFLVRDEQRQVFEAAAEGLAERQRERISLRLLGPLAPFDFVPEESPWA